MPLELLFDWNWCGSLAYEQPIKIGDELDQRLEGSWCVATHIAVAGDALSGREINQHQRRGVHDPAGCLDGTIKRQIESASADGSDGQSDRDVHKENQSSVLVNS